jgi:hypothetical protein
VKIEETLDPFGPIGRSRDHLGLFDSPSLDFA